MRKHKKKSSRGSWTDGEMYLAVRSVINDEQPPVRVAENFNVPRTTLRRKIVEFGDRFGNQRIHDGVSDEVGDDLVSFRSHSGFRRVFSDEQEQALLEYIIFMENNLLGLTSQDVRRIAYQLAVKLDIKHNFDSEKGLAGKDWFQSFKIRHNLSIRKSEGTSRARAYGFNKDAVDHFFTLYHSLKEGKQIKDIDVHNVDETPVSVNPKKTPMVVARKGQRQVGSLTASERGKLVTAELCMSAEGRYMPPMLIFPKKNRDPEYLVGLPEGAWAEFVESGWVDMISFLKWFTKFCVWSMASPERPVMLVLDGHVTHVKNLAVIDMAREKNVHILCLPPHCTHRMQPIDVGFMKPLSDAYTQEVSQYQRLSKQPMTMQKISSLFGKAWEKVTKNTEIAVNAFKKTGLVPCNRNVFKDSDFVNLDASFLRNPMANSTVENQEVARYSQMIHEISSRSALDNVSDNVPAVSNAIPSALKQKLAALASKLHSVANELEQIVGSNQNFSEVASPTVGSSINFEIDSVANLLEVTSAVGTERAAISTPEPPTSHHTVVNGCSANTQGAHGAITPVSAPLIGHSTLGSRQFPIQGAETAITSAPGPSSTHASIPNTSSTNVQRATSCATSVPGTSAVSAPAGGKRLTNRPKNSALIVTSDEHRESVHAAQLKKLNKQSNPRKRKTAEANNAASTTKKPRPKKKAPLVTQEDSSRVFTDLSNSLVQANSPRKILNLSNSVTQDNGHKIVSNPLSLENNVEAVIDLSDPNPIPIESLPIFLGDGETIFEIFDDSTNPAQ